MIKFLGTLSLLAATVTPVASQSIIDLAAADGKYGTLLNAVTNTPGVLDTIRNNFPVSKCRTHLSSLSAVWRILSDTIIITWSLPLLTSCAAIFGPTDTAFGDISEIVAGLDESALATVSDFGSHVARFALP